MRRILFTVVFASLLAAVSVLESVPVSAGSGGCC